MTLLRYLGVQLLAYGIDLGTFVLLLWSGFAGAIAANIVAKLAAGVAAFLAHRVFTFHEAKAGDGTRQAFRYFLLLALNVPLASAMLGVILLLLPHEVSAKILADILGVAITYTLSKYFIFTGPSPRGDSPAGGEP